MSTRRNLLLGAAGFGALGWIAWRGRPRLDQTLDLAPHPHVPGFRTLTDGTPSRLSTGAADALFVGLGTPRPALPADLVAEVEADPATALFGEAPAPAIAYFTDIRCPICRVLEADLDRLQTEIPELARITHDYPIFGESSETAARALIAAGPDLATRLRPRLHRTSAVVNAAYLSPVLADLGVDPAPILARMASAETEDKLMRTRALADLFGFPGTPSMVIGNISIVGAQPLSVLRQAVSQQSS